MLCHICSHVTRSGGVGSMRDSSSMQESMQESIWGGRSKGGAPLLQGQQRWHVHGGQADQVAVSDPQRQDQQQRRRIRPAACTGRHLPSFFAKCRALACCHEQKLR